MKHVVIIFLALFSNQLFGQTLSVYQSPQSVTETTDQLIYTIKKANLVYFETVSHHEIAAERGVTISEMQEILFEDGDLTTSLIECQPTTALDLPLKILIWEENDDVYIAFIDPKFMKKRFMLSGCEEVVDDMGKLLAKVVVDGLRALRAQD
ncbi:MAG: DUF302 domain-containing protein [Cyclobacteriaceae bacterium]